MNEYTGEQYAEMLRQRWAPTLGLPTSPPASLPVPAQREDAAGKFQNPKGGLNDAGRKHFGVKKGVTNYSSASDTDKKRWVRWALRFTKTPRPLKDDQGQPTRYALMFRAWGEPVPTSAAAVSAVHTKALSRSKTLGMGENAAATVQDNEAWLFSSDDEFWEDVVAMAADSGPHTGVMIALFPDPDQAQELALDGGEMPAELHVTLAFLGEVGAEVQPQDRETLHGIVRSWAATQQPLTGRTNGLGVFAEPAPVTYASVDAPALPAFRQNLIDALDKAGFGAMQNHGYVPHMTLLYGDARDHEVPPLDMTFDHVVLAFAGQQTSYPLGSRNSPPAAQVAGASARWDGQIWQATTSAGGSITVNNTYTYPSITALDRDKWPTETQPIEPDVSRIAGEPSAFVTEINGRQLVTGPARALAKFQEPTADSIAKEHMLWMHGRFVGADAPNRNGALWSAGDLEMARGSVTNGPLNWLHEARHVIGTLAKADFVKAGPMRASERAAETTQPHISATAAIWRWIYPDEAYVIEQASDQEMLWYSMECISKQVACAGDSGCGRSVSYTDYMAGNACEHVTQRASVRRFVDPVFLGGAVIVPPTRPGWADADARTVQQATKLAEAAYEQASARGVEPDVEASVWEQMMTQVISFAS